MWHPLVLIQMESAEGEMNIVSSLGVSFVVSQFGWAAVPQRGPGRQAAAEQQVLVWSVPCWRVSFGCFGASERQGAACGWLQGWGLFPSWCRSSFVCFTRNNFKHLKSCPLTQGAGWCQSAALEFPVWEFWSNKGGWLCSSSSGNPEGCLLQVVPVLVIEQATLFFTVKLQTFENLWSVFLAAPS